MKTYQNLTNIAHRHLHPQRAEVKEWRLFYGDNKSPWFGPTINYSHCVAEKNRLMASGQGYKKEFFKIK